MAEIFYKTMNRRSFIKTSLAVCGSLITVGAGNSFGLNRKANKETRWAFLGDTHIPAVDDSNNPPGGHYCYNPHGNLRKVVSEVISASVDGVAIAGDLARLTGKLDDYATLKKLLNPIVEKRPVLTALGNHDDRGNFLKVFYKTAVGKQRVAGKHVIVVERLPVRVIILDSLFYVNKVPGLLGQAQRRWLQDYLKKCDDTPTILCVHHTLGDSDGCLLDVPRLYHIIEPVRKVKAIVYGHSHKYGFSEFEGIHLINVPATAYSFNENEPVGWVNARLTARGGDFTLRVVAGNRENHGSVKRLKWRV
ncbi:MAG: metallophosphoesterase family protein [Planctomycetota bacterium]